ncbi:PLxRFG domain-containing protein [Methylibium sp.]|uniref:PLxRFG domain-containing protein n=1 Tax=Methylibium sp. TaxID=2067992 RepID=UPI003D144074
MSDAFPGKIFLSVDSEKPLMAVLGHELIHSMRGGNPVVYEALKRRLTGLLKNEQQYIDKLDAKYAARGVSPAKVRHGEELHGDIVGDFFMDPLFWQDMAKDKPGLFRRVANAVIKFLDNAAKRITNLKPFGSEDYLADIAAARRAVATTMREFSEVTAPEASLPGSEENFSLADALTSGINNVKAVKLPAGYLVQDLFNRTGKLHWWHKTVGTMNNLAQRSPEFKRVYDATQSFINDVSAYGTAAADLAPTILPKLEGWKDIVAKPLSPADTKAISAPIFEGTLTWARDGKGRPVKLASLEDAASGMSAQDKAQAMLRDGKVGSDELKRWQNLPIDSYEGAIRNRYEREYLTAGVVWKDAELRSMFGLNDKQIGLYKEFRAATDKSLTNLAISDMLRYGGDDVAAVRQAALDAPDIDAAAELLRDHLFAQAEAAPERADVLNSTGNGMIDKADKAKSLMQRGYAPLSRFGQYTVYVTEGDEQRYFGMFESAAEANRMARRMKAEFPEATVQQGTVSQEAYKMFAGVSPETLELFGGMLGLETQGNDASSQAFQTYLKLAKSNRSAMKRLIQRKGIAGFSEDAGRVLAGFVYSNARQTSSNLHMGEMTQAASDVSKGEGELKDQAVRLVDYVKNPQEEAQALRGLLFAQYLGGSVASAMVNITQPFAVTFPYLSQYGGATKAGKQMSRALADVYKKNTGDAALDAALKKAENDGIVSPQEVHQLMQQAQGSGSLKSGDGTLTGFAAAKASNAMSKFSLGWGKLFSTAEQFNRRITFIAAYRTAVEQGMADPAAFAADVVNQTQFTYNKGNKPAWARGAIGGTLFTFKQYSISYVELMSRLWRSGPEGKKAAALGIGMLMLMSGADELPFTEDVDDVIDGFMQRYMGYNFSTKQQREQFLTNLLGEGGGRFVLKGVSGLAGVPVDLSGRLGMGNLLPGTGLIPKKTDYSRDLGEFAGPAGDFAKRIFQGAGKVLGGDVGEGVLSVTPVAARNFWKAKDMWTTGMYRDDKGRKVIDTDGYEALAKAIGFQPNDVARVQDATGQKQQMISLNKIRETEIADDWAQGVFEKDDSKIADARAALRDWNQKNPESPIRINPSQVMKRVRSMREDKATRIAKTAPKEIRAAVRADLAVANQ